MPDKTHESFVYEIVPFEDEHSFLFWEMDDKNYWCFDISIAQQTHSITEVKNNCHFERTSCYSFINNVQTYTLIAMENELSIYRDKQLERVFAIDFKFIDTKENK